MPIQLEKICKKVKIDLLSAEHAIIFHHMDKNKMFPKLVPITLELDARVLNKVEVMAKALNVTPDAIINGMLTAYFQDGKNKSQLQKLLKSAKCKKVGQ